MPTTSGSKANANASTRTSWWKPPGLMEVSDADLLRTPAPYSTGSHRGCSIESNGSHRHHSSKLAERIANYITAPSGENLGALYQITRRSSTQALLFSTQQPTQCLRLLDVLAERVLIYTVPADDTMESVPLVTPAVRITETQQLLDLVYLFSKATAIGYPSHPVGKLLQALVTAVVSAILTGSCENETVLKMELVVLAEMLKINAGVRIYVKELKKIKEFYRALTILLNSTEDAEFLVYSMAILARLVLSESLGAKLFSTKNVGQALELVFSVLEGTWSDQGKPVSDAVLFPNGASQLNDLLRHTPVLQCMSVDLMCALADRSDIMSDLECYPNIDAIIGAMVTAIHMNSTTQQIEIAAYFLSAVASLGLHFRKLVVQHLGDAKTFLHVLQVVLHPSKMLGNLAAKTFLKATGEDVCTLRTLLEPSLQKEPTGPVIAGLSRLLNEAATIVQQADDVDELSWSEEYRLGISASKLLAKLCMFPSIRAHCVESISLSQSVSIVQVESSLINTIDPHLLFHYQPRLSINTVVLLSCLADDPSLDEKHKRSIKQFLNSSEVATVLATAFIARDSKELVLEALLVFHQYLSGSSNARFDGINLAEGILNVGQRFGEAIDTLQSSVNTLQANSAMHTKSVEKFQAEIQQILRSQDEAKAQQDQELQEIKNKFIDQLRQKDDVFNKTREQYEVKFQELNNQCESMAHLMNKNIGSLQQREYLLQEHRSKRGMLEEENNELKRKVQVLELRLDEIAQSHSVVREEKLIRDKELKALQEEISTLSNEYTGQREELEQAHDLIKALEGDLNDRTESQETAFKELVLLSKAHKALSEEKDEVMKEMESVREEQMNLASLNTSIQERMEEKKEIIEQLERKVKHLQDASVASQRVVEEEREKRHDLTRDLDDLRKAHRKLESELAIMEVRAAETRLVVEAKDDHIRKCDEEIRHLSSEVNKQSKLQALIHQLSSGGDPQAVAASAFLARDS